jgi:ribonuclease P protein component
VSEPQAPAAAGERLRPQERLRRRGDYLRCYRQGRRRQGKLLALYFAPNRLALPRLGITASRKVGKAVTRQRLKRRVREIYRRWNGRPNLPAVDLVVHLHPAAGTATFEGLRAELTQLLAGVPAGSRSAS